MGEIEVEIAEAELVEVHHSDPIADDHVPVVEVLVDGTRRVHAHGQAGALQRLSEPGGGRSRTRLAGGDQPGPQVCVGRLVRKVEGAIEREPATVQRGQPSRRVTQCGKELGCRCQPVERYADHWCVQHEREVGIEGHWPGNADTRRAYEDLLRQRAHELVGARGTRPLRIRLAVDGNHAARLGPAVVHDGAVPGLVIDQRRRVQAEFRRGEERSKLRGHRLDVEQRFQRGAGGDRDRLAAHRSPFPLGRSSSATSTSAGTLGHSRTDRLRKRRPATLSRDIASAMRMTSSHGISPVRL